MIVRTKYYTWKRIRNTISPAFSAVKMKEVRYQCTWCPLHLIQESFAGKVSEPPFSISMTELWGWKTLLLDLTYFFVPQHPSHTGYWSVPVDQVSCDFLLTIQKVKSVHEIQTFLSFLLSLFQTEVNSKKTVSETSCKRLKIKSFVLEFIDMHCKPLNRCNHKVVIVQLSQQFFLHYIKSLLGIGSPFWQGYSWITWIKSRLIALGTR